MSRSVTVHVAVPQMPVKVCEMVPVGMPVATRPTRNVLEPIFGSRALGSPCDPKSSKKDGLQFSVHATAMVTDLDGLRPLDACCYTPHRRRLIHREGAPGGRVVVVAVLIASGLSLIVTTRGVDAYRLGI